MTTYTDCGDFSASKLRGDCPSDPGLPAPHLRLVLTEACNLKCRFCHVQSKSPGGTRMSAEMAADSMRSFAAHAMSRGFVRADLSLYGGEPLLNRPALEAVFGELETHRTSAAFQFLPILNTNGLLLDPDLVRRLARAGVRVHLSLNGTDESSNAVRVTRRNESTVAQALESLRLLSRHACTVQINVLLTENNMETLEEILELAAGLGCRSVFIGLQDGNLAWIDPERIADRLLVLEKKAFGLGIDFTGPWAVGRHPERGSQTWPPLNLIVKPDGRVSLPHFPEDYFPSVAAFFSAAAAQRIEELGKRWAKVLEGCASCSLYWRCLGYLQMMVRYHGGTAYDSDKECSVARRAESRRTAVDPQAVYRTSLDLRVLRIGDNMVRLWNELSPDRPLELSADVVYLLDWFLTGGTPAEMRARFELENAEEVLHLLIAHRLLAESNDDSDRRLLSRLGGIFTKEVSSSLFLAARERSTLEHLESFAPWFQEAQEKLPPRLRPRSTRFSILGLPDNHAMGKCLGMETGKVLDWMAGTLFHSIVILNLNKMEQARRFNGRAWLNQFKRGLLHEFVHLGLRHAGLRLPLWLEEGICQMIASPAPSLEKLSASRPWLPEFCTFVSDGSSGRPNAFDPGSSLLVVSTAPIDENPAYTLAHDLALYLASQAGDLDGLLDISATWGVLGIYHPFSSLESPREFFGRGLSPVLDDWRNNLTERLGPRPVLSANAPYSIVEGTKRSLLYHRFLGGYWMREQSQDRNFRDPESRNFDWDSAASILASIPPEAPVLKRWNSGAFPERRIRHLRLHVHTGCNMRCNYCYGRKMEEMAMPMETADKAVRIWRDMLRPGDHDKAGVRFFGGEPLLNWPVVRQVLATAAVDWPGEGPLWILNTNGTLIDREIAGELAKKGDRLRVGLSLDGIGDAHDADRHFAHGGGSFHAVNRGAMLLAEAGVPVEFVVVIHKNNVQRLLQIVEYALQLRDRFRASIALVLEPLIHPQGYGGDCTGLLEAHFSVLERCRRDDLPVTGKLLNAFSALTDPMGATGHFCAATGAELSVAPSGALVFCAAVPGYSWGALEDLEKETPISFPKQICNRCAPYLPDCEGCEIEGLCGGGCAAQAFLMSKDLQVAPGEAFCRLMKGMFHFQLSRLLNE